MSNLSYTGGWNGGSFYLNGSPFSFKPDTQYSLRINGQVVLSTIKTVTGVDHDHGHEYKWYRKEPTIMVNILGVDIEVSLLPHIQRGVVELVI